jgi:hypothetical protein
MLRQNWTVIDIVQFPEREQMAIVADDFYNA